MSIPGAPSEVEIQYRIDGGPIALFPVSLNPAGNTRFFVGPQTVKGLYTFIAFRARGTDGWIRANASILRVLEGVVMSPVGVEDCRRDASAPLFPVAGAVQAGGDFSRAVRPHPRGLLASGDPCEQAEGYRADRCDRAR